MQPMKDLMLKVALVLVAAVMGTTIALAADPNCTQPSSPDTTTTHGILYQACGFGVSFAGCGSGDKKINSSCSAAAGSTTYLETLTNTFLFAAGLVAFIFVLMGGFRYITSTGDPTRIKRAKETLLYAIIGLIVAILAVPIADFVINKVAGG